MVRSHRILGAIVKIYLPQRSGFRSLGTTALIHELQLAEPSGGAKISSASQEISSRFIKLEVSEIVFGLCPDAD